MRPYLVFVRAGANSLHARHILEDPERNWDCCISWYSDPGALGGAEFSKTGGVNKFDGLETVLSTWPGPFDYRYVLIVDDDVYFEAGDISRYFLLCERHGLFLSQPALSWRSFFGIRITLRNAFTLLRRVTFVEVMTPCMSATALKLLRPTFGLTQSTWGIDLAWTAICAREHPLHIVDEIAVTHTKPIERRSGAFYRMLRAKGVDPGRELADIYTRYAGRDLRVANLRSGHIYRRGIPHRLGAVLFQIGESAKVVAKLAQSIRRKRLRWQRRMQESRGDPKGANK